LSNYPAKGAYRGSNAEQYDDVRFRSLRGWVVDALEWRLLARSLRRLERSSGECHSIVDVPVGTGRMALRLTLSGIDVTALDVSEDMLRIAESKGAAAAYVAGSIEALHLEDASVDVSVSVRLYGHLPADAKRAGMGELHRVSRLGAVVFFAATSPWLRFRRSIKRLKKKAGTTWYPITLEEARELAESAGFEVLAVRRLLGPISETCALVLAKTTPSGRG
jgi:ubiquinone/menaquinone biosynthesis C-methylase UbiE